MKEFVFALFCMVLPISLAAQTDTMNVASDQGEGGNLNTAIANVINADPTGAKFSNTVFKLEAGGFYILTGTITTPSDAHFYLVGPAPGNTPATSLPQIVWTTSGGVTTTYNFDCHGDVTMKNVWILCGNVLGSQVGSSMVIEDDSVANAGGKGEHLDMDGCIIDYQSIGNGGGAIEPSCQHFRAHITNTYFRNLTDPHYRYYGRPVSWTYQSTAWHTDTLMFENCTIANVGYAYMQESPEYGDYVSFNHCTFLNTMMYTLESSYWWWLSVTNCIFHNAYMFGNVPGTTGIPDGGTINIDSIANFASLSPAPTFTDSSTAPPARQRHILFANCSYSHDQWYFDYLADNAFNNSQSQDSLKVHLNPMMSAKTYRFFAGKDSVTGHKLWPYINAMNLYPLDTATTTYNLHPTYSATYDPGFILAPTNMDSIKGFLLGRWYNGANISWAYDPGADCSQEWPMNEDLSYTNSTLKTAAMGGFPLGDLFWWWGTNSSKDRYTAWKAQADNEHAQITIWLTNGVPLGVKKVDPGIPGKYDLGQNFPNPFNPTTEIRYSVPQKGNVSLKVYNVLGQYVATLFSGEQQPGSYTVTFDGSQLSSGVYFYRLQGENVSITKKLVLMK